MRIQKQQNRALPAPTSTFPPLLHNLPNYLHPNYLFPPYAEALGAIGTGDCVEYLSQYAASDQVMLRESCQVGELMREGGISLRTQGARVHVG